MLMSNEYHSADDGGYFIPDTAEGLILVDEIDRLFAGENPNDYMGSRFPDPPNEDRIHGLDQDFITKHKIIGSLAVGSLIIEFGYLSVTTFGQLISALRSLH
jgi:hypothetical protein